ncbi:MAG: hypothetical protein ABJQ29_08435 [Luteolibacter sp.]
MKRHQKSTKFPIRAALLLLAASICCTISSCASSRVVYSENGTAYYSYD